MTSSVARVKFIKTKVIFSICETKGISNQVLSNSRIQKLFLFKFQYQNGSKRKSGKKFFWATKRDNRIITNRGRFWDYKSGQEGLQIGAA